MNQSRRADGRFSLAEGWLAGAVAFFDGEPSGPEGRWARESVPPGWLCAADVGLALGIGPRAARYVLQRSTLPAKVFVKHWRGADGRRFTRRCWGVPPECLQLLMIQRARRRLQQLGGAAPAPWRREEQALQTQLRRRRIRPTWPPQRGTTGQSRAYSRHWAGFIA